jgi:hypothetical protein
MSLHVAAKHLASKGRNGDSTLVHMSPGEVKGLQALAMAHGGSLTINPDTGLVEASFLKRILPMVAGAALMATGVGAPLAAGMVGGFETLRTGDVGKGLMAGMGAYGGANLAGNLATAAVPNAAPGFVQTPTGLNVIPSEAVSMGATTTPATLSNMSTGAQNLYNTPGGVTNFLGSNKMNLAMSAAPAISDAMTPAVPGLPGQEKREYPEGSFLSPDFQAYTPRRPNPYYRPTGLGYAAQGGSTNDIMMAAGGSFDDEPMGDDAAMAAGGSIGGYSDGGRMLKGPGDGMSDSIPAMIGKRQPARLADGEFVVPADVVSHLGNGSTDAGAKHLYSMMDKVRKARTGTKKQGKQIKPQKFMPA